MAPFILNLGTRWSVDVSIKDFGRKEKHSGQNGCRKRTVVWIAA